MRDKQITKNQHYVPRFYMKNFANIKVIGEEEKVFTSFYQFDKKLLKKDIPTKSICYEKYFYGEDGKLENEFANSEIEWANIFQHIINSNKYDLSKDEEKKIKDFAIFQYSRTLAMYNHNKDLISELVKNIIPKGISNNEKNILKPSDIVEICKNLLESINDLDISVIKFTTSKKLITSDMPIIMINPFSPNQTGFSLVGIVILFPISPEFIVMIYDRKVYTYCNKFMVISDEQDVINLNKYQIISAEDRIMSKDINSLLSIINDEYYEKLISIREKNIQNRKMGCASDGEGKLLAFKNRKIYYDFELSFCKLPKNLKKIPITCRQSFERKYNHESRFALLFRVYRLPKLIKKDLLNGSLSSKNFEKDLLNRELDYKKIKKGYSNLLKFMDYYWNVPNKDKVITPKLMKEIESLDVKLFNPNEN